MINRYTLNSRLKNIISDLLVQTFPGPSSRYGTKVNQFDIPVTGKCFRLMNLTCIGACAVRWELIGCKQGMSQIV